MNYLRFIFIILLIGMIIPNSKSQNAQKRPKKELDRSTTEETRDYLDMLETTFFKLRETYVDSINEAEIIKSGIKGMLNPVDPYTKLLVGSSKERYDMLKTGKYGGVGIQIGMRRDTLTVLAPMEDSPAYSEGIHSGDQIYKIDSTFTEGMKIKEVSELIRGELGTTVTLHILRPYPKQKLKFELTRANIKLNDVPYWGLDENSIGYIRVKKFSRNTAKDFRNAVMSMTENGMEGLVIDLRSNSGGLLSNAIRMLDILTSRGEELLSSKGRINRSNKSWSGRRKPLVDNEIPIAVLINRSSASASEILAGVLQDLDRAVIIGQNSFGKGLVQSMFSLNDTTTLKVTTAKYYTPSGRLIQKQDYLDNGFLTDGLDKHDSLFVTTGGRIVKGGGGIAPDIVTEINPLPPYVQGLWRESAFLTFAASYVHREGLGEDFEITSKVMSDFEQFLSEYDINYTLPGEKELDRMKEKMSSLHSVNEFSLMDKILFWRKPSVSNLTKRLHNFYESERKFQFNNPTNYKWIVNGLKREFSRILIDDKARIKASLEVDSDYHRANEVVSDLNQYYDILSPQDELGDGGEESKE
jgi:carboxyl-terminal processing protease